MKIISPVETFRGHVVGLNFVDGVAEAESLTEPQQAYLERQGYVIEGEETPVSKVVKFEKIPNGEIVEFDADDVELIAEADKDPELKRVQE
jgi:hypothetical protein